MVVLGVVVLYSTLQTGVCVCSRACLGRLLQLPWFPGPGPACKSSCGGWKMHEPAMAATPPARRSGRPAAVPPCPGERVWERGRAAPPASTSEAPPPHVRRAPSCSSSCWAGCGAEGSSGSSVSCGVGGGDQGGWLRVLCATTMRRAGKGEGAGRAGRAPWGAPAGSWAQSQPLPALPMPGQPPSRPALFSARAGATGVGTQHVGQARLPHRRALPAL